MGPISSFYIVVRHFELFQYCDLKRETCVDQMDHMNKDVINKDRGRESRIYKDVLFIN